MKIYQYTYLLFLALLAWSCEEDLTQIDDITAPSNLSVNTTVSQDGSGNVEIDAAANGALIYHFYPGVSPTERPEVNSSGKFDYAYRTSGDYTIKVVAYGPGGVPTNANVAISIEVTYEPPADLLTALTGDTTKQWVWKKSVAGHLGVGPPDMGEPIWYQAVPFEKESEGCLYEDTIQFVMNSNNTISYELLNNNVAYFNAGEVNAELGLAAPGADQCYDYDISGSKSLGFFESSTGVEGSTNISFTIGSGGFMSYFLGSNTYEILSYSDVELRVRVIQTDDGGGLLAWYHIFEPLALQEVEEEDEFELVWSDEFDAAGAPSSDNWAYDLGNGDNGWGNGEAQFYTDRPENVVVSDGSLKITAQRENFSGSQFTSARLKTEGKFEFTHGKIEVRAKLPTGGGTWPAIWMLGADYLTNDWPAAGEMDIMEHIGNRQDVVQAAVHSPSSFGDTQNKGELTVNGVSDEFKVYTLDWSEDKLVFGVDGNDYYTYDPAIKDDSTYPFNKDFFIILNVAMGGSLGGDIAQDFTASSMEVDYVRVYQKK
ncbi:MAG: hypothetical protein Sapg2KO_47690 [Saprospiraceae bacterium]